MTEPTPPPPPRTPRRLRPPATAAPSGARRPRPARPAAPEPPTTSGGEPVTHLVIGRITAPFGLKGEVKLTIQTDFPERFRKLKRVLLGDELTPHAVERGREHGRFAVLKLAGVDSVEAAEKLRGQLVQIPIAEAVTLPKDTWYWHDLIGIDVWTAAGERVGVLDQILETGSNDVYLVRRDGSEFLIPAIESVIKSVDTAAKRMVIEPIPGMID